MTKFISTLLVVLLWAVQAVATDCPKTDAYSAGRAQIHSQIFDVHTNGLRTIDSIRTYQKGGIIYAVWGTSASCPRQGCAPTGSAFKQDCSIAVTGYTIPSTTRIQASTGPDLWFNWNLFDDSSGDVNTKSVSLNNTKKSSGTIIFTQSDVNASGATGGPCAAINLSSAVLALRTEVVDRPPGGGTSSSNVGTGLKIVGLRIYAAIHPGTTNLYDAYSVTYVDSSPAQTFTPDAFNGAGVTNDCKTDATGPWYDTYWAAVAHGSSTTISQHLEPNAQLELYQSTVAGTISGDTIGINTPTTAQPSNTPISVSGSYGGHTPNNTSTYAWGGASGCTGSGTVGTWAAATGAWSGKVTTPTTISTLACTLTVTGGGPNVAVSAAFPITITGSGGAPSQTINTPPTQTIGNLMALSGSYLNGKPTGETYTFAGPSAPTGSCPTFNATGGTWSCSGIPVPSVVGSGYTVRVVGTTVPNTADSGPSGPFTVNAASTPTITLNQPGNMVSGSTGNALGGAYTIAQPTAMNYTFGGPCAGSPTAMSGFSSGAGVWSGTATAPTVGVTTACPVSVVGTAGNTASSGSSAPIQITVTAQTITLDPIGATQTAGIPVTITGTYTNGIPDGLKYRWTLSGGMGSVAGFSTSGGSSGTWTGTVIMPSANGKYKLTVTGTATNTAKSPPSNLVTVQAPPPGGC